MMDSGRAVILRQQELLRLVFGLKLQNELGVGTAKAVNVLVVVAN